MSGELKTVQPTDSAVLSDIAASLRELVGLTRFGVLQDARTVLGETLATEADKTIYQMSTGDASTRQIAAAVGVSDRMVRLRWRAWAAVGIVEEDLRTAGRFKHVFDLEVFGLEPKDDGRSGAGGE